MPPASVEAEQALLGAILISNRAYDQVANILSEEHFADPAHGRIYRAIGLMIARGSEASAATLTPYFADDEDLKEMGGAGYLARLTGAAVTVVNIRDYAETVREQWLRRQLIMMGEEIAEAAWKADIETSAETILSSHMTALFELAGERRDLATARAAGQSALASVQRARESGGEALYVKTGLADFDKVFGGLPKSEVIVLAGRPSMGKTGAATSIAVNAARAGTPVHFITREMSADQLALRIACAQCAVDGQRARKGWLNDDEMASLTRAVEEIEALPIQFDETAGSAAAICASARTAHRRGQCGMLVIDYLQLIEAGDRYRGNKVNEIGEITRALKQTANMLDIPVLLLSQLSRAVEGRDDKRPVTADLRGSGDIEQDAGMIIFLYRPEFYVERSVPTFTSKTEAAQWEADNLAPVRGIAQWIVDKYRHGDAPKTISTHFDKRSAWFSNLAQPDQQYDPGF